MRSFKTTPSLYWLILLWLLMLLLPGFVAAESKASGDSAAGVANQFKPRARIEVKRENTNRGTEDESTKTNVKISAFFDGPVSLLRLELPFPDLKTDFEGDPFSPRLGDIKIRTGFRTFNIHKLPLSSFVEATFPTADPEDLGSGKYQVTLGVRSPMTVSDVPLFSLAHKLSFEPLIQQVVSVAGDENRKDINYTKLELVLKSIWQKEYWLKFTAKPVVDWVQDAKTGAVAELEAGWNINRHWDIWMMLGTRLWGEGVPSTYDQRVSLGVALIF